MPMTSCSKAAWITLVTLTGLCVTAAMTKVAAEMPETQSLSSQNVPAPTGDARDACEFQGGEPHAVLRITDANSIVVDDGREVRLAGILFPPSPPQTRNTWAPANDAHAAFLQLTANKNIRFSQTARQQDRYGRTLAAVHLSDQNGAWVQHSLVEQGHAIVSSRSGASAACLRDLLGAEQIARSAKRGLWANAYYQVHAADRPVELLRLRSQFALVEGTVVSVTPLAGRLYISFGGTWKSDFTIVVPKPLLLANSGAAERLTALVGKQVRVRGWIESRYGPSIEIYNLADIETIATLEGAVTSIVPP